MIVRQRPERSRATRADAFWIIGRFYRVLPSSGPSSPTLAGSLDGVWPPVEHRSPDRDIGQLGRRHCVGIAFEDREVRALACLDAPDLALESQTVRAFDRDGPEELPAPLPGFSAA